MYDPGEFFYPLFPMLHLEVCFHSSSETRGQLVGAMGFSQESPWAFTRSERVSEVFEIPLADFNRTGFLGSHLTHPSLT